MNTSWNNTTLNNSGGSEIAQLQKRLNTLTKQLRDTASGSLDPKTKMEKSALIQQEIQIVSAQIAALQREQKQTKDTKASDICSTPKQNNIAENLIQKKAHNIGSTIDAYA